MSLETLPQIDRAFQNNNLADHLSTIAHCANAIRDNPFPLFVNGLLLRLADVFQGEKLAKMEQSLNLVRLRIIKLLQECGTDLAVAFSSEEIVRRVMKVSHSNDYKSRSLTMLFMAAVAPVVYENKKVHYMLVESLDCDEMTELLSAIIAAGSMGRLSYEFSSLVVEKIGAMVEDANTDAAVKVRLMDDLSFFQENVAVTKQCMQLGRTLLRKNSDQRIAVAVVGALTQLAKRNGLAWSEQISLVLDEIDALGENMTLLRCYFANLLELSESPQNWSDAQVERLCACQKFIIDARNEKAIILWLQCAKALSQHLQASTLTHVAHGFFIFSQNRSVTVRLECLKLMFALLRKQQKVQVEATIGPCILGLMSEMIDINSTTSLADRFYTLLVEQIKSGDTQIANFNLLDGAASLMKIDETYAEPIFVKTLETLNALCDFRPDLTTPIAAYAFEMLAQRYGGLNQRSLYDAPLELYSLALLPIAEHAASRFELIERVQAEIARAKRWWFAYRIARQGFRYGHWSDVALPLLEQIQDSCTSLEASTYISALIFIASSRLPERLDVSILQRSYQSLRHAHLLLAPLAKNTRNAHNFAFAAEYIDCLCELYSALTATLAVVRSNSDVDASDMIKIEPSTSSSPPPADSFDTIAASKAAIDKAADEFARVRQCWLGLLQRSFDADEESQQHVELMARHCALMETLLHRLQTADDQKLASMPHAAVSVLNQRIERLLERAIDLSNEQMRPLIGSIAERSHAWTTIFHTLGNLPLTIPRYFFQQLWRTSIKLNVLPQPKEHEKALVLSTRHVALSVEGIINSTNPKRLVNVTVRLRIYTPKTPQPRATDYRQCLVRDNYFKAQFLLDIRKNAELVIGLTFTDAETKRTWEASTISRLNVTTIETGN